MASGEFKSDLESEQVWLSGLHQFIQQGEWAPTLYSYLLLL